MRWQLLVPFVALLGLTACETEQVVSTETIVVREPSGEEAFNRGRRYFDEGDFRAAVEEFTIATRRNPNFAEAFYGLGRSHEKLGATSRAQDAYRDCLNIQPGHAKANYQLALIYFQAAQYTQAEGHFKRALATDAGSYRAHFYLGEIGRLQGQCQPAKRHYQQALAIKSDFYDAEEALRELERDNCRVAKEKAPSVKRAPVKPKVEEEFRGGGRALKPGEW